MKLSHDPCVCGGATRLMYKNETHYYCEKCGGEVMPHDCGVVGVKREDLEEAIEYLDELRGSWRWREGTTKSNIRETDNLDFLLTRLRAAKEENE